MNVIPRVSDTIERDDAGSTPCTDGLRWWFSVADRAQDRDGRDARWDQHRTTRRDELVDAALRAIRTHSGAPSMDQIAEAAGTSKAVLYRYFNDQAGLFAAVAERIDSTFLQQLETAIEGSDDAPVRLAQLITRYLELIESDPDIYRFLEHQTVLDRRAVEYPSATTVSQATALFAKVLDSDAHNPPSNLLMAGIISLLRTVADQWITSSSATDRPHASTLATELAAFLWNGTNHDSDFRVKEAAPPG